MKKISTESTLLDTLYSDIDSTPCSIIAIIAGHFPLRFDRKTLSGYADIDIWGDFSRYTLELGCILGQYAKKKNKQVKFIFVCDDITYNEDMITDSSQNKQFSQRQHERKISTERKKFYTAHSGTQALVHPEYNDLLTRYQFNMNDILRQDQQKKGREESMYFSEIILKHSFLIENTDIEKLSTCSKAYISLLNNNILSERQTDIYTISFVPNKCSHYICDAVDFFITDFKGSHVFMDTIEKSTRQELFERGVYYKKDSGFLSPNKTDAI